MKEFEEKPGINEGIGGKLGQTKESGKKPRRESLGKIKTLENLGNYLRGTDQCFFYSLTTIRHQTGSRNRNAMVGNQPTDEAEGRLGRYGRKEEAAVVRARTYASQGPYAPPDRQLDLKGAPESDYEGPDLQSVVEQQARKPGEKWGINIF